jgi:hypothetical protein
LDSLHTAYIPLALLKDTYIVGYSYSQMSCICGGTTNLMEKLYIILSIYTHKAYMWIKEDINSSQMRGTVLPHWDSFVLVASFWPS